MDRQLLTEKWADVREALLDGLNGTLRENVEVLLENQRREILKETAPAGSIEAHDIANYRHTLLPMIRRIIPGTIGTEIVGVQAMDGPVAQVYTMRYVYEEEMNAPAGFEGNPFGGFDISPGDEAFGNDRPIRRFYAGSTGSAQLAGASGIANPNAAEADIDVGPATGEGWESSRDATTYETGTTLYGNPVGGSLLGGSGSFLEGSGGRKMTLRVVSQTVEAKSRKLQAGWTLEAMQDAKNGHGLDIETEMTKGLTAEIVQEIDAEIIGDLLALAGTVRTFDYNNTGGPTYAPAFAGDRFANLGVRITEVANEIARKTRRGAGNFIVASPMMVSVLTSAAKAVFAPAVQGSFKGPNNTELVGTLNGTIKVYNYLWNQAQSLDALSAGAGGGADRILVGYKGGNGETDTGYWYTPYIPVTSTGVIMNPVTTTPMISLMTRYGKLALTDPTTSLGNSADYYGKINVVNLDFV